MLRISACDFGVGGSLDLDAELPRMFRYQDGVGGEFAGDCGFHAEELRMELGPAAGDERLRKKGRFESVPSAGTWSEDKSCTSSYDGGSSSERKSRLSLFEMDIVIASGCGVDVNFRFRGAWKSERYMKLHDIYTSQRGCDSGVWRSCCAWQSLAEKHCIVHQCAKK